MEERRQWNSLLESLERAQNRMKQMADRKREKRSFEPGDDVYLKLQPYRQTFVSLRKNLKLTLKFYGPYKLLQKVGTIAYK